MSRERHAQARMLVRLRRARMDNAARALSAARKASLEADAALAEATALAEAADQLLASEREELGRDLGNAPTRLARVQQSLFQQAVSRSAANDASEALRICAEAEQEHRHAMILAQARHDVLADHSSALARRADALREEQAAAEIDDIRRRRS